MNDLYTSAIYEAAGLLEPSEWSNNPEYLRGMTELIARLFPMPDLDTEAGSDMAKMNIAFVLGLDN